MQIGKAKEEIKPEIVKQEIKPLEPLEVLFSWKAPSRAFKERDRQYFTTIFIIIFVLSLILVFIREFLLIGVILSLTFVYYVLSTVAPEEIEHKITTRGVVYAGTNYPYEGLLSFFFSKKYESQLLNVNTKAKFPGRMFMLIKKEDQEKIAKILSKYLNQDEEPKLSFAERLSQQASKKISLE
ncbi:hypothetical protein L6255_03190 [Candidatus Parcubacteria bacterium]|nr:hypothetical protein [Patescibacteria group bacterium]MBU4381195.1 hypothetical protein [Patescibacteria group bacterium]MCG2689417.1 hypothetical protein [Candidatus Parcubacteria bacterium]